MYGLYRNLSHCNSYGLTAVDSDGGNGKKALVKEHCLLTLFVIADDKAGKLLKSSGEGCDNRQRRQLKQCVNNGDADVSCFHIHKREVGKEIDEVEQGQNYKCRNHVEGQVNHRRAAGVLARTDRGDQCADAGTDVLTHDNGDSGSVSNGSRGAQCLKHTDGRGGGLNDSREYRTHENSENGV